jgi:hypothetical protein
MSDSPESPPPASPPPASPPPASPPPASPSAKTPYEQAMELKELGLNSKEIKAKLLERGLDAESAAILAHGVGAASPRAPLLEMNVLEPLKESFWAGLEREAGIKPRPPDVVNLSDAPATAQDPAAEPRGLPTDAVVGGVVALLGLAVTVVTYLSAEQSGGTYVIAWGAILFGAIRFFRGLNGRD